MVGAGPCHGVRHRPTLLDDRGLNDGASRQSADAHRMLACERERIGGGVGPHLKRARPEHDQIAATVHHPQPAVRVALSFGHVQAVIDLPAVDVG